ncbi:MAG: hypothetical protein JWR10_1264 [Rubritepida sp.]|nr:hypothetical protein [Rubritepida sp.]
MSSNSSAVSPATKAVVSPLSLGARAYPLLALLCLLLFAAEGWHAWTSREAQLDDVETSSANLARSLLQEAEGTFATVNAALVGVVERLEVDGTRPAVLDRISALLTAQSRNQPGLRGFSVDSRSGERLVTSVPNLPVGASDAERPYFQHHKTDPGPGSFIGPATRSQLTGNWIITISRRFEDQDGQFAGVVVASVEAAEFARGYAAYDVGRQGSIALLRTDGMILSRHPYEDAAIGRVISGGSSMQQRATLNPVGNYRVTSPIDGVERLASYHRSDRFPIILLVATGADEALSDWAREAWLRAVVVVLVAVVIVLLGSRLVAQIRRRRHADLVLARSEAQFRMLAEHASDMVSRVGVDGLRRYASPAAKRLLGIPAAELVGRRPEENIHPDDRPDFDALVASLGKDQEQGGLTYRAMRSDGTEIWVESTLRLVRDPKTGVSDGYVGISRDVTISKAVEAKLAALATTDGLTGIANRRHFDNTLFTEWRRAARDGKWLGVLMLDVDHFKGFNDRYGHLSGDECLRTVASVIAETIRRPGDIAARYGGEEFGVILPSTDLAGAKDVAERVRAAIEAAAITHGGNDAGVVTASIGVAVIAPTARAVVEASALVGAADGALYAAKRSGRNRVIAAEPSDAAPAQADEGAGHGRG